MAADELRFPSPDDQPDAHDPHAAEVGARLRASYAAVPPHSAARMDRVARAVLAEAMHAPAPSQTGRRPRWWWGAAAAALFVIVLTRPWTAGGPGGGTAPATAAGTALGVPVGRTDEEPGDTVRFDVTLPDAAQGVALVGDFNGWDTDATPMARVGTGRTWSARVTLEPGRHEYAFVVDGQRWVVDALAPQVPDAGFGPTNAVVVDHEERP